MDVYSYHLLLDHIQFPWFMDLNSRFLYNTVLCSNRVYFHHQTHQQLSIVSSLAQPLPSFLGLLVILLCFFPVVYWTPSDLGHSSLASDIFGLLYSSLDSHRKYTGVVCHSLLQWIMFYQNSLPWPIHPGWSCKAWLITSLNYASTFTMTRQLSMKGWQN